MSTVSTDRTLARRQQVLDAAASAFRRRGFHAASMAEIAKAAGMSPGHIYNLFQNKDDVIAAIVEHDCAAVVQRIIDLQREDDVLQAMLAETHSAFDDSTKVADAALTLEILAEASRNPALAAVLQRAQAQVLAKVEDLIRQTLGPRAEQLPAAEITARAMMLGALFNGLTAMSVRQPDLATMGTEIAPVMQRLLRLLLTP
ncbi:TetR/AcrR family transcriptional regulator [Roseateles sp.]|uniref:TetR/AcrR family transcriptional regulator n=1 Tax=Roseateles sp. TaxID=1971397 RepID=UPI0025D5974E|nr:TetR/AcrR family transcriptional regulator [Roseateles sp.]MBV8036531.1 TetR/AcrR family transcriptional regulator [Roseateles sp.]